jgi:hypothetical protein
MAEETPNIVLEHLRAIRADLHDMRSRIDVSSDRLEPIELSMVGLRRDQAGDAENVAYLGARIDKLNDEIDRIKRRLELID